MGKKSVRFISSLFKGNSGYFEIYFKYINTIDRKGVLILHLGSGWDKRDVTETIRSAEIISIDRDLKSIKKNRNDLKICGDGHSLPLLEGSFDYVICEDLMEHIEYPEKLLKELNYILKDNGEVIFITPGGWSYISIVSKLTPLKFHKWYNNRLRGVDVNDIHPAYYRFNSVRAINRLSDSQGFKIKNIRFITGYPSYFNFSKILTIIFGLVHYLILKIGFLNKMIGINIFCVIKKT